MSEIQQTEIKNIGNLLARTAEIAEQAGITGIYEDGARRCVHQFNASVTHLEALAAIPAGFFTPLPEAAGFGEVGIACAQLASYLGATSSEENETVYHGSKYNVTNHHHGSLSIEELQELRELREILRQRLSEK